MCWSFLPSSQNNTCQENDHIGQQTLGKQLQKTGVIGLFELFQAEIETDCCASILSGL